MISSAFPGNINNYCYFAHILNPTSRHELLLIYKDWEKKEREMKELQNWSGQMTVSVSTQLTLFLLFVISAGRKEF